jgi:hypothetical protein
MGRCDADSCDDGSDGGHPTIDEECRRRYIPGEEGRHLLMREILPKRTLLEKAEALLIE